MRKVKGVEKANSRLPGRLLKRAFFEAAPERVATGLLGKLLVSKTSAGLVAGRIVEVEAYLDRTGLLPMWQHMRIAGQRRETRCCLGQRDMRTCTRSTGAISA
jgi:hypothetical protein